MRLRPAGFFIVLLLLPGCSRRYATNAAYWKPDYRFDPPARSSPVHRAKVAIAPFPSLTTGPTEPFGGTAAGWAEIARLMARDLEGHAVFERAVSIDTPYRGLQESARERLAAQGFDGVLIGKTAHATQFHRRPTEATTSSSQVGWGAVDVAQGAVAGVGLAGLAAAAIGVGAANLALIGAGKNPLAGWSAAVAMEATLIDLKTGRELWCGKVVGATQRWRAQVNDAQNEALKAAAGALCDELSKVSWMPHTDDDDSAGLPAH